jgi:murein tripeptide amidase MpaA
MGISLELNPMRLNPCRVAAGLWAVLACLAADRALAGDGPYSGHRVVRVTVHAPADLLRVTSLTDDVWSCDGVSLREPFDIRVTPEQYEALRQLKLPHRVIIDDVQRFLDEHLADLERSRAGDAQDFFNTYRTRAEIEALMDQIAANYPHLASVSTIGASVEGRPIRLIRLSGPDQPGNPRAGRPVILVNGCQHAREWIGLMTTVFFVDRLAEEYGVNARLTALMDRLEFYIVPIVNPDGYEYTWTPNNRLWRKNRRPPPTGSTCWGVDLNRNWGFQWGLNSGSSGDPCSETYRGAGPFSEPETVAMKGLIDAVAPRLRAHLDMHSYAQKFLSPWGYTTEPEPPDLPLMNLLGQRMRDAIAPYRNRVYEYGQGSVILYLNSGNARDYTYGVHQRLAWTWESPNVSGNFAPNASEIRPTCNESIEALIALADYYAYPLRIALPAGAPVHLTPDSPTVLDVTITPLTASTASASLWWRAGESGPFTSSPLTSSGGHNYTAQLPATTCGTPVHFYLEAASSSGDLVRLPEGAPGRVFTALAANRHLLWHDAGESAAGWSLSLAGDTATAGRWENAAPNPTVAQPGADVSPPPGTRCFVTDARSSNNAGDYDVDGGVTTLTSPAFNALPPPGFAETDVYIAYHRWLSNNRGSNPDTNPFTVQLSNNNGVSFVTIETVTENTSAWVRRQIRVSDYMTPTASMRLRFIARDTTGAIVEAAVDECSAFALNCPATPPCLADWNGDGVVDFNDLLDYLNDFNAGNPRADLNGDGVVDFNDLLEFLNHYNSPCP